jgi:hypothetical protein
MDQPFVSVVIPTWNRRELLRQAIESVIAQTCPNWEIIVVDDGSTDGTADTVRSIGDQRIKLVACEHSGRKSHLRNLGIAASSGEFVGFLDSDDLWMPRKLEIQLEALRRDGADWCYGDYRHIDETGAIVPMRAGFFPQKEGTTEFHAVSGDILAALLKEETIAYFGTVLVRRSLIDVVGGFDESLNMIEDLDLVLRLAANADAAATAECVAAIREHSGRVLRTYADVREEAAGIYGRIADRAVASDVRTLARQLQAQLFVETALRCLMRWQIARALSLLARARASGASMTGVAGRLGRAAWRRVNPKVAPR